VVVAARGTVAEEGDRRSGVASRPSQQVASASHKAGGPMAEAFGIPRTRLLPYQLRRRQRHRRGVRSGHGRR
jgi:hypothetical protein